MTPLQQLIETENAARNFGFDWPNQKMIIEQTIAECHEVLEDIQKGAHPNKIQEEIGDVLHAAISLCIFSGFDVEETLSKTNQKFKARMAAMEILTKELGLQNLKGQSMGFMLELWDKAKHMTNKGV